MSALGKIFSAIVTFALIVAGAVVGGAFGAFIGAAIGAAISAGIDSLFNPPRKTDVAATKINVRLEEPIRNIAAGRVLTGGAVIFGEFASDGDLWYIVIHSDSPLTSTYKIYLDDIAVTLGEDGAVLTKDFRLASNNDGVGSDGAGETHIWLHTATYTASDPIPPFPSAEFRSFFSQWTDDHLLVGTTYTVVHCLGMKTEDRYKWYKWRGSLGMGEPSVSLVGDWARAYDPRDETQTLGDPTTYKFTRNSALIWAWFRTHHYGRNKPESSINWDRIAEQADICDETVVGVYSDQPRYQCDVMITDDTRRGDAESEIIMTMDGQIVYDDDGKSWVRAGYYETPTITLTRNRDILGMESVEAIDGESETQGVIVRFTDPEAKYSIQPSAAWTNPLYYTPGQAANFAIVEIPSIQNHNQAMRIAKAIGMRVQPAHKLGPTISLRGLRCARERFVNLNYDNTFAGDYEIATQVELDASGIACQVALVPVDEDRWTLLSGEEKPKPVVADAGTVYTPDVPSGVTVVYANSRLEAVFDSPVRYDTTYRFLYIPTTDIASGTWAEMTVLMYSNFAYSGPVAEGVEYTVRYLALSANGVPTTPTDVTVSPIGPLADITDLAAYQDVPGSGVDQITWRNPVSPIFATVDIYRGTTTSFGSASISTADVAGGLGEVMVIEETLSAGTYYYWAVTKSATSSNSPVGPVSVVVT